MFSTDHFLSQGFSILQHVSPPQLHTYLLILCLDLFLNMATPHHFIHPLIQSPTHPYTQITPYLSTFPSFSTIHSCIYQSIQLMSTFYQSLSNHYIECRVEGEELIPNVMELIISQGE